MSEELLAEILAAHADHLNAGGDNIQEYLAMFPAEEEELAPLMYLAAQLKHLLTPAQPRPTFVEALSAELLERARARLPADPGWRGRLIVTPHWPERFGGLPGFVRLPALEKRHVIVGAAAGGAGLAAAGVAAYMLRDRLFGGEPGNSEARR